jgi:VWFA-related protein
LLSSIGKQNQENIMLRAPRLFVLGLSLALVPAFASFAQERTTFEENLTVSEVLLDVLVTDQDGNVIVGLGPEDFVVREGDDEIPVESASFYSNRELFDPTAETVEEPDPRYFILFLHDRRRVATELPGLLSRQLELGRQSRRWIQEEMIPGDWVAILRYDEKLHVHSDFSQDRAALDEAMDQAVAGRPGPENWPSRAAMDQGGSAPSLLSRLPKGKELAEASKSIYDALELVAVATEGIVGRKNVMLFSTGFGRVNSFGQYEPDSRYFGPMVETLNQHNVAVYPVDMIHAGNEHTMADSMHQIAEETGARYFFFTTSFLTPMRQIAKETNGYYLLSYRRERPASAEGFQKVDVTTRNQEFRVTARQGYQYGG